jgi:hypothetical protein
MILSLPVKLLAAYLFAAICLTILIIASDKQKKSEMTLQMKNLSLQMQGIDRRFCERINQMHKVRGFEVIDCESNRVVLDEFILNDN